MKLKVRVVHYRHDCWYADIDDADDRQPDDPFWYVDGCRSHAEALALACAQLAALDETAAARLSETGRTTAGRLSEADRTIAGRLNETDWNTGARRGGSAPDPAAQQRRGVGAGKAVA